MRFEKFVSYKFKFATKQNFLKSREQFCWVQQTPQIDKRSKLRPHPSICNKTFNFRFIKPILIKLKLRTPQLHRLDPLTPLSPHLHPFLCLFTSAAPPPHTFSLLTCSTYFTFLSVDIARARCLSVNRVNTHASDFTLAVHFFRFLWLVRHSLFGCMKKQTKKH